MPETNPDTVLDRDYNMAEFYIVEDATPQEEGGIRKGRRFKRDHIRRMLDLHSLAEGTLIRHIPTDQLFRVHYPEGK